MNEKLKNLLYVDDEKDNLVVFRSAFRRDYNIFLAESADEGTRILQEEDIQVIVTDQRMPGKTGVEFLESTLSEFPDIVKIILTGFSDIEVIIQAVNKVNLFGYIQKPWDKAHLKKNLDNAFESFWLKKDNEELVTNLQVTLSELNTFLYRASHDLRGPIARMIGLAQIAKLEDIDDTSKGYFDKFESSAQGLQRVLDKLVIMKTVNEPGTETQKINFENIYKEIKSKFEVDIREANIAFSFNRGPDIDYYSNVDFIRYVMLNLIENAVQFRNEVVDQPEVIVSVESKGDNTLLIVKDNGIGISDVHKPKIYDMFYRGVETSNGSGLGLYIAKRIMDQIDGSISINSEKGKGTEVIVEFPGKS